MINYNNKAVFCVQKALKYLCVTDKPWKLALICREFQNSLENKILQTYLTQDNKSRWHKTTRVMIWKSILKTHLLDHNYAEMIKKVESHHHNHEQTKIEEIIVLDVNR